MLPRGGRLPEPECEGVVQREGQSLGGLSGVFRDSALEYGRRVSAGFKWKGDDRFLFGEMISTKTLCRFRGGEGEGLSG